MPFGAVIQKRQPVLFAGRFRHKVALVQLSKVQDETGGIDLSANVVYAKVWASIEDLIGTDKFAGASWASIVTHQIVIRYIGAAPSWQQGFNYPAGALVKDSNGNLQQIQTPGVSGANPPTWQTSVNQLTNDGAAVWKNIGPAPIRTGVSSAMQVWYEGRQFQIEAVLNPDGGKKALILMCHEINDSNQQITTQPDGLS